MAFPTITADSTAGWVEFWNSTFQTYLDGLSSGSASAWPIPFTQNGRILRTEADGLDVTTTTSPSLALVVPANSEWLLNSSYVKPTASVTITGLSPNFTGWVTLSVTYDATSETWVWSHTESTTQPARGTGVCAKVVTIADRVSSIDVTEANQDVIPLLPVVLARIRNSSSSTGTSLTYISQLLYSADDPRTATIVIEEKIADALAAAEAYSATGATKVTPTNLDQMWNLVLGLLRGIVSVYPDAARFVNAAVSRPGIYGTDSAPDTPTFDLGGTLPAVVNNRDYEP